MDPAFMSKHNHFNFYLFHQNFLLEYAAKKFSRHLFPIAMIFDRVFFRMSKEYFG
jgi:hypothetical protein